MMDSIGYQFDPTQSQQMTDSMNNTTSQFGTMGQRALRILAMRLPSLMGGQPLANGQPMMKPMMPQPGDMNQFTSGGFGGQQGGLGGMIDGALKPGASPDEQGQISGSMGGWTPGSPNATGGGDHLQSLLEALHRARSAGGGQQAAQRAPGAMNAGRMSGPPAQGMKSF